MISVRLVVVGGFASLYGILWAMCICGIAMMVGLVVLSFVSVIASSFPWIFACVLIFWMVILYGNHVMRWTIETTRSFFGWLCWEDGLLV